MATSPYFSVMTSRLDIVSENDKGLEVFCKPEKYTFPEGKTGKVHNKMPLVNLI